MEKLVSIIVPVYKVEKYLRRCIDSVLNQTYKNIEVILVDDGSPDKCGKICDEYAKDNKRVKVFHKKNGGLSDARNYGLKKAQGQYIYFLDSDDWIETNTIAILAEKIIKTKADIAVGGIKTVGDYSSYNNLWYDKDLILNHDEAIQALLENKFMASHACNKLFKREVIKKFSFPKGLLYEDIYIMHKIFLHCEKVAITKEYLYDYYQREDSISNQHSIKNDFEYINAFAQRYQDMKDISSIYDEICYYQLGYAIANTFLHNCFTKTDRKIYKMEINKCLAFLKSKKLKKIMQKKNNQKQNMYIKFVQIFKIHSRKTYLLLKRCHILGGN